MFAITGPTGAGKTTILDAVCLALYGRTPRLVRVVKSGNEIMSRQTGECFAEVTFETQQGHFRCHWSQHRARRAADGELQAPRHEIADAESGKILETKVREVAEQIERITGMDFERFTRSMLLAQGGFAAFLQASPDDRSPILEQITGTDIYSQISMQVHKRQVEERNNLNVQQAELKGMQFLSSEDERNLRSLLTEKLGVERELTARFATLSQMLAWRKGISALEKDVADLDKGWRSFEERQGAFQPERQRLERARCALVLSGDYQKLLELRRQQLRETNEMVALQVKLPAQEIALTQAQESSSVAARNREEARAQQRQEAEVIRKVREVELRWTDKRQQSIGLEESLGQPRRQCEDCRYRIGQSAEALKKGQAVQGDIELYLVGHDVDAGLISNLFGRR